MSLKVFVKVGSISNLSDARYCAAMGVNVLGFRTDPNDPAFVSQPQMEKIIGWISGPKICAEIGESIPSDLNSFDYIQTERIEQIDLFDIAAEKIIFKLSLNQIDSEVLQKLKFKQVKKLIVESHSLKDLDIGQLDGFEVIVQTSSELEEIESFTAGSGAIGLAMDGSIEERTGFKTYDELADALEFFEE